jgi:hypothetical protein
MACFAVACLVSPSAGAADVLAGYGRYPDPYPLAVLGSGAVWLTRSSSGRLDLIRGQTGQPAKHVLRVSGGPEFAGTELYISSLTASGERAAFGLQGVVDQYHEHSYVQAQAATVANLDRGAETTFRTCGVDEHIDAALTGPWLVVAGCSGDQPGPVDVFDLSAPGQPPVRLAPIGGDLRVDGHMAAWIEPGEPDAIVVVDLLTHAEISRIQTTLPLDRDWDVQADGKVAAVLRDVQPADADRRQIAWFAPGDPPTPTIVTPGGHVFGLRMADDQLVFERPHQRFDRSELVMRSLSGHEVTLARYLPTGAFDFDGTHAAWIRQRCDGSQVVAGAVSATRPDTQRIGFCPITLDRDAYEQIAPIITPKHVFVGAYCHSLLPPRTSDRCKIKARLTARGRTYATRRFSVAAGRSFDLKLKGTRALWRRQPDPAMLRVTTTMRGHTHQSRNLVEPLYENTIRPF